MTTRFAPVTKAQNLGDLLKFEAPNHYSRERTTVVVGQNLELGSVVGVITASGKTTRFDPAATNGCEVASGVLIENCDASLTERDQLRLGRAGERRLSPTP